MGVNELLILDYLVSWRLQLNFEMPCFKGMTSEYSILLFWDWQSSNNSPPPKVDFYHSIKIYSRVSSYNRSERESYLRGLMSVDSR